MLCCEWPVLYDDNKITKGGGYLGDHHEGQFRYEFVPGSTAFSLLVAVAVS